MTHLRRLRPFSCGAIAAVLCVLACGCHDGPLYGLKRVNPYFTMREWKRDRELGVTDHQRRQELQTLASQIGDMNTREQAKWATHLDRIIENDPSPEMRRLSILAASNLKTPGAIELIERGLDDESLKVQMEACRSLGKRREPEAAQLLASTLGTTPEADVKNSAIAALGKHKGNIPVESLRLALEDRDPATIHLAMQSLKGVIGKDYGSDPQQWIAAIDAQRAPAGPTADADDVRVADGEGDEKTIR
ncbi:HEAT repeat domain-containing protein [Stieleria neptunia]|nr:HEAT repeat domain-containing protein [Stieleria neptunia]